MPPRTPLGLISGNSRRGPELNDFARGEIAALKRIGLRISEITREVNRPWQTVKNVIARLKGDPQATPRPHPGAPEKASDRDKRAILRVVRGNPKLSARMVVAESGVKVSESTIRRILKRCGLKHWLSKKRPLLTKDHAQKRREWCLIRKDWSTQEWKTIIFSDECSFERGSGSQREWV